MVGYDINIGDYSLQQSDSSFNYIEGARMSRNGYNAVHGTITPFKEEVGKNHYITYVNDPKKKRLSLYEDGHEVSYNSNSFEMHLCYLHNWNPGNSPSLVGYPGVIDDFIIVKNVLWDSDFYPTD